MNEFDMEDEFTIPFTERPTQGGRTLVSGHYAAVITSVKRKTVLGGKLKGLPGIDWSLTILHGPMRGMNFIINTLLGPDFGWTTNKLMASLFPSIQPGETVSPTACIGLKLEVDLIARPGKDGRVSKYVNINAYYPYVENNYAGDAESAFDSHLKSSLNSADLKPKHEDEIPF